jgi:DNA-directed RNA polymerase specialized sigma24 family protein
LRIRPSMRARLEPADLLQEVWFARQEGVSALRRRDQQLSRVAFRIGQERAVGVDPRAAARSVVDAGMSPTTRMLALEGVPQNVTSFTQRLANEESIREFLKHAEDLDENDRMLLIHCGLEDETCAEAAPKLGLSRTPAIKRWQRLKAKLRDKPGRARCSAYRPSAARTRPTDRSRDR